MVKRDFLQFSTRDFILDDSFQQWVFNPASTPSYQWSSWLAEYPSQKRIVDQAKTIVEELRLSLDEVVTLDEAESGWSSIESRLN